MVGVTTMRYLALKSYEVTEDNRTYNCQSEESIYLRSSNNFLTILVVTTVPMIHVSLFYAEMMVSMIEEKGKRWDTLYSIEYLNESLEWADGHSGLMIDLCEFKNKCCECDAHNPYYDDECIYYDHYILDKFYINKEFRGQGLAYESLYVGLRESGCTDSFLYFYLILLQKGKD